MRLTLSHKLTIIIASVLGLVLLATLATTYQIVSSAETISAQQSLARVGAELARSVDLQTRRQGAGLRALATDTSVRHVLLADSLGSPQLRAAIRRRLSLDSGVPVRIWNRDGRELQDAANAPANADSPLGVVPRRDDSTRFGPLYEYRDTAVYWVVSPMLDATNQRLGWIGERRLIASSPEEQKAIQAFLGGDVAVYFRNDTGSLWVDLAGQRASAQPSSRFQKGVARYSRSGVTGDLLAADADIRNTPWSLVLERPRSAATAAARASLLWLAGLGLALLLAVTAAVWLISRRFAQPVMDVASAAQTMTAGSYQQPLDDRLVRRKDEVGQLARSFNDMAAEVQSAHTELERQVQEARSLNQWLGEAVRDADEAGRAKTRFVTRMSHELRTPLNAIAGYTELLEMGIHGPVNDEQRGALERIRHCGRALLSLIDDVLGLARLESGQMRYTIGPVPVSAVVSEAHSIVSSQLASKAIRFELVDCDALIAAGDFEKVRRILTNLLSNAIKFTEPHGAVSVHCRLVDEQIHIDVQDTGIGIASDRLDVIFQPFVQLRDDLTRTAEGMGLGLALSRDLARGMSGDLTASSQEGVGSVFTLTLPREAPAQVLRPRETPNEAGAA